MAEGADVTIRYAFLPTESSIKEGAQKVLKQFTEGAAKQKWGSGIYSEAYHKRINQVMKNSVGKIDGEYKKTTSGVINLLRAFQQKTSLQTKLMALMKFAEGKGITGGVGGEGGGIGGAVGGIAGGGVMAALGLIAGLLVVISVGMTLISAFFDAVGPIIKVVMKMVSAMILILLMPFLKRGLPVLFGILKWMIQMAKGIANFADTFMTYIEKLLGKAMGGDPMAIFELLVGPLGMLVLFLGKKLVEFLAGVNWNAIVAKVIPILEGAFNFAKDMIKTFVTNTFGSDAWNLIKAAIEFIKIALNPGGIWTIIKGVIDYIDEEIFNKGIWKSIRDGLDEIGYFMDVEWQKIISGLMDIGNALEPIAKWFRDLSVWFGGTGPSLLEQWYAGPGGSAYGEAKGVWGGKGATLGAYGDTGGKNMTPPPGWTGDSGVGIPENYRRIPGGGVETIAERDARMAKEMGDFISRPGAGIIPFSSSDTIIGTKNPGAIGGTTINTTLNVSAGVDKGEFRKLLTEFSRQQGRELRTRTSYYGG